MQARGLRTFAPAFAALCALTLAPAFAADEPDHMEHRHSTVRISASRLHPKVQRIHTDDALAWINYSPRSARILFDGSVATKLACRSRASFTIDGDRLVSSRIQGRQFASLCQLAPGEYAYTVELGSSTGEGFGAGGVSRTLKGTIIVTE